MITPTTMDPSHAQAKAEQQLENAVILAGEQQLLQKAIRLVETYMRKERRGGGTMLEHCAHVAAELARAGHRTPVVIAGLLHDIVEDSDVSRTEIMEQFGSEIAHLVDVLTKPKGKKKPKHERAYLQRIKEAGKDAVIIKIVDNTHNLQGCTHLKRPREYVKYGYKIQAIGVNVLGEDHPLVLNHLMALRSAQAKLVNMPG